jgi:hypothetical protein
MSVPFLFLFSSFFSCILPTFYFCFTSTPLILP